jgi:hypothetical protein
MQIFTFVIIVVIVIVLLYLKFLRPWQLRWGATDDEVKCAMPGDNIVQKPNFVATRAVSIKAPPSEVWKWIVQIGSKRVFEKFSLRLFDTSTTVYFPRENRCLGDLQNASSSFYYSSLPFSNSL